MKTGDGLRVLAYVRVSTDRQEAGPGAQRDALETEAKRLGWNMSIIQEEASSAATLANRPVLAAALGELKAGRADALAVSKLDRLSRSVADFAALLETANKQRWALIAMDLNIDTSTITGALTAQVTVAFAEMERRRIGERTREGMARIRATTGKHMGMPSSLAPATRAVIHELHAAGMSFGSIAAHLNDTGTPTATGRGRWHRATVKATLESATSARLNDAADV